MLIHIGIGRIHSYNQTQKNTGRGDILHIDILTGDIEKTV